MIRSIRLFAKLSVLRDSQTPLGLTEPQIVIMVSGLNYFVVRIL